MRIRGLQFLVLAIIVSVSGISWSVVKLVQTYNKVMILILENTDYDEALKQPFLGRLVRGGALLSNYHAVAHPSEPNYLALACGTTAGVEDDKNYDLELTHIGDLLEAHGKTWKIYEENPGHHFLGASSAGLYCRKHNAFISFKNMQTNPERCDRCIVNADELYSDIKNNRLPDYSVYVPNVKNDGHDTGAAFADKAMDKTFSKLLTYPGFTDGLLFVVTFDESESYSGTNQVLTVLYGDSVRPGVVSKTRYDHYSLLRTVEDHFGLGTLGRKDQTAVPITGIWK